MLDNETVDDIHVQAESHKECLNVIMADYGQAIQQLVFTYVKDHAMTEDLTQEIFLKFYRKLDTFKRQSSLKTWLYRIAINHCKDYLKSWQYRQIVLDDFLIDHAQANNKDICQLVVEKSEEQELVSKVLRLPLKYREVVYLYYYEELTSKEISQLTRENENTIKTRLNRARQMIKNELGEEGLS